MCIPAAWRKRTKVRRHCLRKYNDRQPCSHSVLETVHAADHDGSLFVVPGADFISPGVAGLVRDIKDKVDGETYNTAVMSWTATVRNANSLSARLDGQNARMPFGRRP